MVEHDYQREEVELQNILTDGKYEKKLEEWYPPNETSAQSNTVFWWIVNNVSLVSNGMGVGFRHNHAELKSLFDVDEIDFSLIQSEIFKYESLLMQQYNDKK